MFVVAVHKRIIAWPIMLHAAYIECFVQISLDQRFVNVQKGRLRLESCRYLSHLLKILFVQSFCHMGHSEASTFEHRLNLNYVNFTQRVAFHLDETVLGKKRRHNTHDRRTVGRKRMSMRVVMSYAEYVIRTAFQLLDRPYLKKCFTNYYFYKKYYFDSCFNIQSNMDYVLLYILKINR